MSHQYKKRIRPIKIEVPSWARERMNAIYQILQSSNSHLTNCRGLIANSIYSLICYNFSNIADIINLIRYIFNCTRHVPIRGVTKPNWITIRWARLIWYREPSPLEGYFDPRWKNLISALWWGGRTSCDLVSLVSLVWLCRMWMNDGWNRVVRSVALVEILRLQAIGKRQFIIRGVKRYTIKIMDLLLSA